MTIHVNVVQVAPNHQYVWSRDGVRRTDQWMVLSEGGDSVMSITAGRCAIPIASLWAPNSATMTHLLYARVVSLVQARVLPTDTRDYILRIFVQESFRVENPTDPRSGYRIHVGMAIAPVAPEYLERELAEDVHRVLENDLTHDLDLYCRSIFPVFLTLEAIFVADTFLTALRSAAMGPGFDLLLEDNPAISVPDDLAPGLPRFNFID